MTVTTRQFGRLPDGSDVDLYVLDNGRVEVRAITYGAIITSLRTVDRDGGRASIVLGHGQLEPYIENPPYLGAVVGRFANRIARGRFSLDGRAYQLSANDGPNHLHGGPRGFHRHVWNAAPHQEGNASGVVFTRLSPDGEEGYPGALAARVAYVLSSTDDVTITYEATTSAPTIVNLTQHTYFDLSAGSAADVLAHELTIDAGSYLPVDDTMIPLGDASPVADTPFDFRAATSIGSRLQAADDQLRRGRGYDHSWVLDKPAPLARAARAADRASGRSVEVWTTEPGLQFYSGNLLDGSVAAAGGRVLRQHAGFCLETQHFPDSPNQPAFPSTVLRPGETYRSTTVWRCGCA